MKKNPYSGYLYLIAFSLLSGFVGILVKMITLDAYSLAFFRAAIAFISIFAILLFTKKIKELRPVSIHYTILIGIFEGISILLFFLALQKIPVANAIFLAFTAPAFSILFAWIFLKEKIEKKTILSLVFVLAGVTLIADFRKFSFDSSMLGNLFALGSGMTYALMGIFAKPLTKKASSYYIVFWQYLVIAVMFSFSLLTVDFNLVFANVWKLLALGIVCTAVAVVLFMKGVKRVKAQEIFLIISFEPIFSSLFAFLFLKEVPSFSLGVGAVLIMIGIYITSKN
jgi:drug/metabolite transporter (DMT)-like permease